MTNMGFKKYLDLEEHQITSYQELLMALSFETPKAASVCNLKEYWNNWVLLAEARAHCEGQITAINNDYSVLMMELQDHH
ncbi:hypothetical protein M0R45_008077 [Rubus argutus]|uniref:Uncharacterized protein n=1 Tax=Rubus argutus TaxID=59490 RepID=A0AAW1Y0A8_RUBAR